MKKKVEIKNDDWRFLALIHCNAKFSEVRFQMKNSLIFILDQPSPLGENHYFVEVYTFRADIPEIYNAFHVSIDLLSEFLDQVSLVSFQPAYIVSPISISYFKTSLDCPFPILQFHQSSNRRKIEIDQYSIMNPMDLSPKESNYLILLRLLRDYQNTYKKDSQFLLLYSVLDYISNAESKDFQIRICPKCKYQVNSNVKKTDNFIRELANNYEIKDFDLKIIRRLRGKLAHGAAKRDSKFFEELSMLPSFGSISSVILSAMALISTTCFSGRTGKISFASNSLRKS